MEHEHLSQNYIRARAWMIAFATLFALAALSCDGSIADKGNSTTPQKPSAEQLKQIVFAMNSSNTISPSNFEILRRMHDSDPSSSEIQNAFRRALIIRKDYELLVESYLSMSPQSRSTDDSLNLARAYLKLGRAQDSLEVVAQLVDSATDEVELNSIRGKAYYTAGDLASAAHFLDASWPEYVRSKRIDEITTRGLIYYQNGDSDNCIKTMLMALEMFPENKTATNTLSRVYADRKEMEKAAHFRELTSQILDRASREEQRSIKFTSRIYDLQDAWADQRFEEVAQIAKELIPEVTAEKRTVLYQYLIESYKALGNTAEAERAAEQLRQASTQ